MGGSFGTLRWYPRLEHFWWTEDFNNIFQEKDKRFRTPYVITVDRYPPEARKTAGSDEGTRLWELRGMNGWQGTPRSEELGGKCDLESRGSTSSCTPSQQQETTHHSPSICKFGNMLVFKEVVFLRDFSVVFITF